MTSKRLKKLYERGLSTREIAEKILKHKKNPYGSIDSARANILRAVRLHHVPDKLSDILKDIDTSKKKVKHKDIKFTPRTTASKAFIEGKKKPKKSKPIKVKKKKATKPKPKKEKTPKKPKKEDKGIIGGGGSRRHPKRPHFWDRVDTAVLGCRCESESPQIIGVVGGSNETVLDTEIVHEFMQVFDNRKFKPTKKRPTQSWQSSMTVKRPNFANLLLKMIERHDHIYKDHTLIDVWKLAVFNSGNKDEYTTFDPFDFEGM